MSRIGREPIPVLDKVQVTINGSTVSVKGPKGNLERTFRPNLNIENKDNNIQVTPKDESRETRALWGLTRTLISNMVTGVADGFEKKLEFTGVGYKAAVNGKVLNLNLGYSHPIDYQLPEGIEAKVDKNTITVSGADKELVGFASAKIRSFRPPEPYKGKGIKYADERIIRKAGKSGKK